MVVDMLITKFLLWTMQTSSTPSGVRGVILAASIRPRSPLLNNKLEYFINS
jgi:hypothetical protein